eukprot:3692508-Rhodomonas_salina.1
MGVGRHYPLTIARVPLPHSAIHGRHVTDTSRAHPPVGAYHHVPYAPVQPVLRCVSTGIAAICYALSVPELAYDISYGLRYGSTGHPEWYLGSGLLRPTVPTLLPGSSIR